MKKVTASERRFAQRLIRQAVGIAERSNAPRTNQRHLWRLMVNAANGKRVKK